MSAYEGYSTTYGRMYGMSYPPAATSHYHHVAAGLQSAAAGTGGPGTGPTPKAYNGLCLTGTGVDLLHPAMVYPGTFPLNETELLYCFAVELVQTTCLP